MVTPSQDLIQELATLYAQKRFEELIAKGEALIQQYPNATILHNLIGAANVSLGLREQARQSFAKALSIEPNNAESHNNLGTVQESLGSLDEAVSSYSKAVQLRPDYAEAHNNLGNVLRELGRFEVAIETFSSALIIKPDYAEAHNNLGVAYKGIGKLEAAVTSYKEAVKIKPQFAAAHNNLGNIFRGLEKLDEAVACYSQALKIEPGYAQAHYNLGLAYKDIGKTDEAIACYNTALQFKPGFANAYNSLGNAFKDLGKLEVAITNFKKTIELRPSFAVAHNNLGNALKAIGKIDEAIACYDKALEIKPDYAVAQMQKLLQVAYICDWNALEGERSRLIDFKNSDEAASPFVMLALEDDPASHKARAEQYAVKNFKSGELPDFAQFKAKSDPIRIAYFSGDFNDHPVGRLMARVIELHDRSRFVIHGYSYSPPTDATLVKRFEEGFDKFNDVSDFTDREIAQHARAEGIDIAIDLSGYTKDSRTKVFSFRAAPIQISYLGYPGTMGASFVDYIIADQTIIPPDKQKHYSEKIIYLPHSYQAQDNTMQVADSELSKKELGLPESGFVFCCFNNSYKISKAEFDIWMRLLARVDGSVLWLYEANNWVKENLVKEARSRGIDQRRLIFTRSTQHADYLARLKLADLFLDTFNYNAGATASDALWAGLPVLTKQGASYTARMASSLLVAIEMPELITATEKEYEDLALELATNPRMLRSIRRKLVIKRDSTPLFDTEGFTINLEMAYQKVVEKYSSGSDPEQIVI